MRLGAWLLAPLLAIGSTGCPGEEPRGSEAADDSPPMKAAVTAEAMSAGEADDEEVAPLRRAVVTGVTVERVDVARAENGRGELVDATRPVAIEIAAEAWPARALDPVLRIGDLEFHHYTHPRINVLRYVVADSSALPRNAPVTVQYGDDAASLVVVSERLEGSR